MRPVTRVLVLALSMLLLVPALAGAVPATNPDITVWVRDAGETAVVTYDKPADSSPGAVVTCTPASGTVFPSGTTTVTCEGRLTVPGPDTCIPQPPPGPPICIPGPPLQFLTGASTFTVTVAQDLEAPRIQVSAPAPVTAPLGATGAAVTYAAPTVTDNAPSPGAATCLPASGHVFPVGTSTVTCFAADAFRNVGHATFEVVVQATPVPPPAFHALTTPAWAARPTHKTLRAKGLPQRVMCSRTCTVTTTVHAPARQLGRKGAAVQLARSVKRIQPGRNARVATKLTKTGRTRLAKARGNVTLTVRTTIRSAGEKPVVSVARVTARR